MREAVFIQAGVIFLLFLFIFWRENQHFHEREKLLDRIQAGNLIDYKAFQSEALLQPISMSDEDEWRIEQVRGFEQAWGGDDV